MSHCTTNLRVNGVRPLITPALLMEELPLAARGEATVTSARRSVSKIINGSDDRLLVVVGPCSIHDPVAALDYGKRLKAAARRCEDDLQVVMRVYFEKPRTTVGWKGLINDPNLNGSYDINAGLRLARRLLCDLNSMEIPCGCEFLDPISPQYISGLVSWGAIGARTTESQVHRELASGLSMPIGFKNGTDGNIRIAVDAVFSSGRPHKFLGVTEQGLAAVIATKGNPDCHVVLRGGASGPNYDAEHVRSTADTLERAALRRGLMIDCSHGNSAKDHRNQPNVARALAQQVAAGSTDIVGVMLESHLVSGAQQLEAGRPLQYGQSITDACLGWEDTVPILEELARAVRVRRVRVTRGPYQRHHEYGSKEADSARAQAPAEDSMMSRPDAAHAPDAGPP